MINILINNIFTHYLLLEDDRVVKFMLNNSYMIDSGKLSKINCEKKTTKGKDFAVSGASKPAPNIHFVISVVQNG